MRQAILSTQEDALAVQKIAKTKGLEAAIKEVTGNISAYLGEKDVGESGLVEDIKDSVIAAKNPAVLEPIASPLGYYVVQLRDIKPETIKSYNAVKKEIKNEVSQNQLIDETICAGQPRR